MIPVMTKKSSRRGLIHLPSPTEYSVKIFKNRSRYGTATSVMIFKNDNLTKTFTEGDQAEFGSYNLSYYGPITKITENTVTIMGHGRPKRLSMHEFCWRNYDFDVIKTARNNSETMMYL